MPVTYNPRTNKWDAGYTDQAGKRHRHGFETKKEAKTYLLKMETQIQSGDYRSAALKLKVRDAAEQFIEHSAGRVARKEIDRTTHANYQSHVERFILGIRDRDASRFPERKGEFFSYPLGEMRLADVRVSHVNKFAETLRDEHLAVTTARGVVSTLRLVFAFAVERDMIAHNVVLNAKRLRARTDDDEDADGEVVVPEKAEVAALAAAASHEGQLILRFAAETGVRTSEQRALAWRHVDLDQRVVHVRRRVNQYGQIGQTKSKAGRRTIPISIGLADALAQHKEATRYGSDDDLVFPNGQGNVEFHSNWLDRHFNPAWRAAQAEGQPLQGVKRWRWHALRHFAISCWIEADMQVKQVQKWAGHSSAQMTLDRYGHLFKSADNAAVMDRIASEVWKD